MTLTLTRPDDWHLHLRDGASLAAVVNHTARQFARAIVMPNLQPPVTTTEQALAYRERIVGALDPQLQFDPLMTLYLTGSTTAAEIEKAAASGVVKACKVYPAGATTNSDAGVTDIKAIYPVFEAMEKAGLVLCLHGEVVDSEIDIFDRESVFIERTLQDLVRDFPGLKIVLEHITTQEAAEFVLSAPSNVGATITPQHLRYNRNHMLVGGIKPHFYCLPIIKRDTHRQKLVEVATSGNNKFFLGTDSAPHARHAKETACGCAGLFSAHAAIELYAEVFEEQGALDKLEGFASFFGADFYGLPRNSDTISLEKTEWQVPSSYPFGDSEVVPMKAGETLSWKLSK